MARAPQFGNGVSDWSINNNNSKIVIWSRVCWLRFHLLNNENAPSPRQKIQTCLFHLVQTVNTFCLEFPANDRMWCWMEAVHEVIKSSPRLLFIQLSSMLFVAFTRPRPPALLFSVNCIFFIILFHPQLLLVCLKACEEKKVKRQNLSLLQMCAVRQTSSTLPLEFD